MNKLNVLIACLAIAGCSSYDMAPLIKYKVQRGDTIEALLRAEGLDTNKKLRKGINALERANSPIESFGKDCIRDINKIYVGQILNWLDINRDGKVGYHREHYKSIKGIFK